MSFASPAWLAGLALLPLVVGVWVLSHHRARRYAVRFPATSTLALAAASAGSAASWRRYLPAACALAAIAALALALGRPHVSYQAPAKVASVMLVSDESGSMASSDVQPSRLAAAESAANTFIDRLPGDARVGAIAFSSAPNAVQAPSTDHTAARNVIDSQSANGATDTGDALALALALLRASPSKHPPAAIVLLSDGQANTGLNVITAAQEAATDRVPIYTVALGTPNGTLPNPEPFAPPVSVPPDPQLMAQIAQVSHGRTFDAQSADELSSIYRRLGDKLGSVTRQREVTADFAIGGLVLLLLAAAGSTRWSARLP
jgi:Ca-activated chloride channel family protein